MTRTAVIVLGVLLLGGALIAVVVDSFFAAKQLPRATMCRSDLKQIATALSMYVEDYDQRLPPTGYAAGTKSVVLPSLLHFYIKNGNVWECATAAKDGARNHTFDGSPGDGSVSYGYNGNALSPHGPGLPLERVKQPKDAVAFVDAGSYLATPHSLVPALGGSSPEYRHSGTANVAWLDGHVKSTKQAQLEASAEEEAGKPLVSGIDRFLHWNLR